LHGTIHAAALDHDRLAALQKISFNYFLEECNPANGLIADRTRPGVPASIAAVGMALTAYPVAVARGFMSRHHARERTLNTLRFFWNSHQGPEKDATGYKGFYYHFLDMQTGRRAWNCELSTIDTTLLMAGILVAAAYFREDNEEDAEIRKLADALYRRVDWKWAQDGNAAVTMGWRPGRGFLPYHWTGYDEALILYILGLGSPTYPLPAESYGAWLTGYRWKKIYGREFLFAGPLFIHQMSHIWIDFRGIQDGFMREHGSDYFENSRQATYVQQQYAINNPRGFEGYHADCWGITASDGPGPQPENSNTTRRRFYGYRARGVPFGPDDGTISPWATAASLPFAPEIVLPALSHFHTIGLKDDHRYGFTASFNPTLGGSEENPRGWQAPEHVGINQGPIALMIENYRSDFIWKLMRGCPYVIAGLRRAGFSNGWL
jgi:hypothetical protein